MGRPKNPPQPVDQYAELKRALIYMAKELLELAGTAIPPGGHASVVAFHDHLDATIYWGSKETDERGTATKIHVWGYPEELPKFYDLTLRENEP